MIGGSVGFAARSAERPYRVIGFDVNPRETDRGVARGALDEAAMTLGEAVERADLVVVCSPVDVSVDLIHASLEANPTLGLITDVGSTKANLVFRVQGQSLASRIYVGAHPLAGSERRGVESSQANLLRGRTCVLTPTEQNSEDAVITAREFWIDLGCRLVEMDPDSHDAAMALTSHLPHAVASALSGLVAPEMTGLAAGAFRDGTRVAAADASLWSGIFLENRENLLHAIEGFGERLGILRQALVRSDRQAILDWWEAGRRSHGQGGSRSAQDIR